MGYDPTSTGGNLMSIASEGSVWQRKTREMDQTQLFSSNNQITDHNNNNIIKKIKKKKKKKKKKTTTNQTNNQKTKKYDLISFQELPEYMKDNEYILNYYRSNWPLKEAFFSIFRWHNETLNVWTHLIGFVLFVVLTVANLMQVPQVADFITNIFISSYPVSADANISRNSTDFLLGTTKLMELKQTTSLRMDNFSPENTATRWPFYVFLVGSMFCLLASSICHLFSCHSHHVNIFLWRIDYVGIVVMIITSFFPPIYYIFQCDTHWQFIYLGGITALGVFTVITLLAPSLSTAKYRPYRALLFMSMGFFGFIPAVHALVVNWSEPQRNVTLAYETVMGSSYMVGTIFYVSQIPERWLPGWFDLAGHSHQIFHVFVLLGALAHYGAALVFVEFRNKVGCGGSV